MWHSNDSHKKIEILHYGMKISRWSFPFVSHQDDCYNAPQATCASSVWSCYSPPSKSGASLPPESRLAYRHSQLKECSRKYAVPSEARSEEVIQHPLVLLFGGTFNYLRPSHWKGYTEALNWAQPALCLHKGPPHVSEESVLGVGSPASSTQVFPAETSDIREQRLAAPEVSCPNCLPKEPMIIVKWLSLHATKFKVVCYTVGDN